MIAKLRGLLDSTAADSAVIDVNGVGYLVHASSKTLTALGPTGSPATLHIETQVREDAIQLFGFLADGGYHDNLFISGDAHITLASDLPDTRPGATPYDATTGAGSIGVELMPGSISRGNVDESVNGSQTIVNAIDRGARAANPQFAFVDLVRHGYGLVDVTAERMVAELWYSPILEPSSTEELGGRLEPERRARGRRR